jgi:cell division transport system ATP-binding protein
MIDNSLHNRNNSTGLGAPFIFNLDGATVHFGKVKALRNVNLTVNAGEVLFVTGKSGAGKSTLLNLLAEDILPNHGKFHKNTKKNSFVAQVFQDLKLMENKTCEENLWVSYDPKIYKNKNEFHHDMTELCRALGFQDKLALKVKKANGGLKQKVAMVRALLSKPEVLLADEPTAALDRESAVKLFEILNFYNVRKNLTVIWASHNRDLVKQFPGKIVHLDAGNLVYSGHACFI